MSSRLPGLYRLPLAERRRAVEQALGLPPEIWDALGALELDVADGMIENVVGTYGLPFAVASNFTIDGVDRLVPMVIEEPSVVAASSNAAKMVRAGGGFTAEVSAPVMIGQIQIVRVTDIERAVDQLTAARADLLADARARVPRLVERGGGPVDVEVRVLARPPGPDGGVIVVHLHVDCRDAMGANLVNTLCEQLSDRVAALAGGEAGLRILSNLADRRTLRVTCKVPPSALGEPGDDLAEGVAEASRFADADPYRAVTHNKGIMNGIDAVLVATAQDWRAVEAGAHAFACRDGRYRPLATWAIDDATGLLCGELALPMPVGTVGGALHVHPGARLALQLAGVTGANELAAIAGAAGLATNLAALRALATEGIQHGHMALHARVCARAAGASGELLDRVAAEVAASGDVRPERARQIVARLRAESATTPA